MKETDTSRGLTWDEIWYYKQWGDRIRCFDKNRGMCTPDGPPRFVDLTHDEFEFFAALARRRRLGIMEGGDA